MSRLKRRVKTTLSSKDRIGLQFENAVQQSIRDAGLWKYVTYANPVHNEWQWKRHRGHGVDIVLQINAQNYNLECSYQSHYYRYTAKWFMRDRFPRFADLTGANIIVASCPESFHYISPLIASYSVTVSSIADTISYLSSLVPIINSLTKHHVYAYELRYSKKTGKFYRCRTKLSSNSTG